MISLTYSRIFYSSLLLLLDCTAIRALNSDGVNGKFRKIPAETNTGALEESSNIRRRLDVGEFENCWVQIGSDVVGGGLLQYGPSVDISSTEPSATNETQLTLAVGFLGYAMMLNYTLVDGSYDGEWTPLGENLMGSAAELYGDIISLSADGRSVAVGIPKGVDGNGVETGVVHVYGFDLGSDSWIQLGQDIDGFVDQSRFGSTLELSSDGLTVIVGTDGIDDLGEPRTRVFRYDGSTWSLLGDPIDGSKLQSTSISSDGNIIAIGYPISGETESGETKIFEFVGSSWDQIGQAIAADGDGDKAGGSISLSSDGTVIAIGARRNDSAGLNSGHVRIFQYNSTSTKWEQVGADIDGENHSDNSGASVSLSTDAQTVAIGAWNNGDNGNSAGHVRVFRYVTGEWRQYGHDIDGVMDNQLGSSISLSPDGQVVAIGSKNQIHIFANTNENCTITSLPSMQPTNQPSNQPSPSPSMQPTNQLSNEPSLSQTPSVSPTQTPSLSPSQMPSPSPIEGPTSKSLPPVTSPPSAKITKLKEIDDGPCNASTSAVVASVFTLMICVSLLIQG